MSSHYVQTLTILTLPLFNRKHWVIQAIGSQWECANKCWPSNSWSQLEKEPCLKTFAQDNVILSFGSITWHQWIHCLQAYSESSSPTLSFLKFNWVLTGPKHRPHILGQSLSENCWHIKGQSQISGIPSHLYCVQMSTELEFPYLSTSERCWNNAQVWRTWYLCILFYHKGSILTARCIGLDGSQVQRRVYSHGIQTHHLPYIVIIYQPGSSPEFSSEVFVMQGA